MKDLKHLLENNDSILIFYNQTIKFISNNDFLHATENLNCIYYSLYRLVASGFISHAEYISIDSALYDKFEILYND